MQWKINKIIFARHQSHPCRLAIRGMFDPFLRRCLFFPAIHVDNGHHEIDPTYCTWSSNSSWVEEFLIRANWHAILAIRIVCEMCRLSTLPSLILANYDNGAIARDDPCNLQIFKIAPNCICKLSSAQKWLPTMAIVAINYGKARLHL